jgi:hypothetical protein
MIQAKAAPTECHDHCGIGQPAYGILEWNCGTYMLSQLWRKNVISDALPNAWE